jgi:hypothetical protein
MWGAVWRRCDKCGAATYDIDNHCCPNSLVIAQETEKAKGEFEPTAAGELRWKSFDAWLGTPQGKFELWLLKEGR